MFADRIKSEKVNRVSSRVSKRRLTFRNQCTSWGEATVPACGAVFQARLFFRCADDLDFMSTLLHGGYRLFQLLRACGRALADGPLAATLDGQTLLRLRQHCAMHVTPAHCVNKSASQCSEFDRLANALAPDFNLIRISWATQKVKPDPI